MKDSLATMFSDTEWRPYRLPGASNRIYYNAEKRATAIVLERSTGADFALSKVALLYVIEAHMKGDKVENSFVVLRERESGEVRGVEEAKVVAKNVLHLPPMNGRFGQYWWINESFGGPGLDDRVPF